MAKLNFPVGLTFARYVFAARNRAPKAKKKIRKPGSRTGSSTKFINSAP